MLNMKAAAEPCAPVSLLHQLLGGAGPLGGHCPSFLRLCPRRGEQGRQPAGVSAHLLYDFQGRCLSFLQHLCPRQRAELWQPARVSAHLH